MGNTLVKTQLNDVKGFFATTIINIRDYLNETTISQLNYNMPKDHSSINKLIFVKFT